VKLEDCHAWAVRHHELSSEEAARIRSILDALFAQGGLKRSDFNACLNTRDLFKVVKLVHVAWNRPAEDDAAAGERIADARRRTLVRLLESLNRTAGIRFDAELLDRVYGAITGAGVGNWFPMVGFEYSTVARRFVEFSFYCTDRARLAAEAAADALGLPDGGGAQAMGDDLHALGFDLLASGEWRFKLYRDVPPSAVPSLAEELDESLRRRRFLELQRMGAGGALEPGRKAYAQLPFCRGEEFADLTSGRVGEFAGQVAPVLAGQLIFYVGASDEKVEIYFGVE
jgi:hypothetical protein